VPLPNTMQGIAHMAGLVLLGMTRGSDFVWLVGVLSRLQALTLAFSIYVKAALFAHLTSLDRDLAWGGDSKSSNMDRVACSTIPPGLCTESVCT